MMSKHKAVVTNVVQDALCELTSKVMAHKMNVEQLENNMGLLEKSLEELTLEMTSYAEQKKFLELKADKYKLEVCRMQLACSVPVDQSAITSLTESTTVSVQHADPSSNASLVKPNANPTATSSKSTVPQWIKNNQEFAELQSCYDDILTNMPDDYMQTVQTLERYLCDLHVSAIFDCPSVSDANGIILECLSEHVTYKEHVLEFCERLLLIRDVPELAQVVENLTESVMINLHEFHLQVSQVPEIREPKVFSKLKPHQFTPEIVNLLKKYYHRLMTNIMSKDSRNVNIAKVAWATNDTTSLCSLSNEKFLDILIMKTQYNHQLLRFCSTLNLFVDEKNLMESFRNDLITVFKSSAETNPSTKSSDSPKSVGMKSNQDFLKRCGQLSFKGTALLQKYYNEFLENLAADSFVTLEKLCSLDIAISNEIFSHFMSCSSSQECNREILHFLIEDNMNDNYLLGFSFTMQVLTKESKVAVLFRDECFEMLAENAASTPQIEMSAFFPLTSPGNDDSLTDNPASLRSITSQLSTENSAKLAPPKLPTNFTPRPGLLHKITTALLMTDTTLTNEVAVTIRGIGGIGKSTIAKAVCHERSIKEHFTDGFLWISLTPPHNVTDELRKIYNNLTSDPIEGSHSFVKEKLRSLLMSSSYKLLIILDDVLKAEDALVYIEVFQNHKILVTTRKLIIDSGIQAKNFIDIKQMELKEAVKLLTRHIDELITVDDNVRGMLRKLAEDLHCWPLILNLVRTQLYVYCTEQKMSPEQAISLVAQKISENFTAFDQGNRETAVKSCLDTSLNLLPKQDLRVLRYIVLTIGGFGSYAIKDTVIAVSKMTTDHFNVCVANLLQHGLIEFMDMPMYPTNQSISCIGVNHIVAHYIMETLPFEQIYEMLGNIDSSLDFDDLMKVYDKEEGFFENNLSVCLLYFIPNMLSYFVRATSILACLLVKLRLDSAQAASDQLTMENMYSTIEKDCSFLVSTVMDNKHNEAIEWLKQHFKNHPLSHMSGNIFIGEECIPLEAFAELSHCLSEVLVFFTIMHKCIATLTKVKASNDDVAQVMESVVTSLDFLIDCM